LPDSSTFIGGDFYAIFAGNIFTAISQLHSIVINKGYNLISNSESIIAIFPVMEILPINTDTIFTKIFEDSTIDIPIIHPSNIRNNIKDTDLSAFHKISKFHFR
jgi:hypothetical protein